MGSTSATQAWSSPVPVPTIVETKRTDSTPGQLSSDERDQHYQSENARMSREIHELKEQVWQLVNQPPDIDYNCIVSTVMAALQQAQSNNSLLTAPSATPTNTTITNSNASAPSPASASSAQRGAHDGPNLMDKTFVQDQSFCK
ncbi:hypothetical protein ACA910_002117 [Epithemia clementina (nom. ined.)]